MKKLRLVLFEKCNRSCEGCCNKDWNLNGLPVVSIGEFDQYSKIILTGGEPMLDPLLVINIIRAIRVKTDAPVYMYTAKSKRAFDLIAMLHLLDGITLTLHEPYDIEGFRKLNQYLLAMGIRGKSLRLNVFKGVDISGVDTSLWLVKDNIEWIKDCPLPEDEVLKRLWD